MPDGHNEDIGALKTSVDFLREGLAEFRQEVRDGMRELREATNELKPWEAV